MTGGVASVHGLAAAPSATVAGYLGLLQWELVVIGQLLPRDYPVVCVVCVCVCVCVCAGFISAYCFRGGGGGANR